MSAVSFDVGCGEFFKCCFNCYSQKSNEKNESIREKAKRELRSEVVKKSTQINNLCAKWKKAPVNPETPRKYLKELNDFEHRIICFEFEEDNSEFIVEQRGAIKDLKQNVSTYL